jgi:predicted metal-binding membrane protein
MALISLLSWAYLAHDARRMAAAPAACPMCLPKTHAWTSADVGLMFLMWTVMMVGMMTPSVAPTVLLFASLQQQRRAADRPHTPAALFLLGYLLIWTLFSLAATLAQWGLHAAALLSPTMVSTSPLLGGVLLIAAGVFQLTPLKNACLAHCRTPMNVFLSGWREGRTGALVMGLRHGASCTGCCAMLMALLFVLGVMNLLWVAALTLLVMLEKLCPAPRLLTRLTALLFVGWGMFLLIHR